VGQGGPLNVQNTKICCGFFWIGFRSDRRHYSESLLLDLGVNSPIKWGGGGGWLSPFLVF